MRRNLLIAQTFAHASIHTSILMIAEAREAGVFAMPPGTDCLTLPALRKEADGQYRPRRLSINLKDIISLRMKTIRVALEAFNPDILIVDHLPCGALGELTPALEYLRTRGGIRCILGLRDVLDDPLTVRREWLRDANEEAIREYYDAIWIYGDPVIYDAVREYGFSPDVAAKTRYTGYLDRRTSKRAVDLGCADPLANLGLPPGRLAVCLVGGGQDGARLVKAFANADFPPRMNGIVLTGPFMPEKIQQHLQARLNVNPRLRVLSFIAEPAALLNRADRVIAMGGYNTTCEILSFEKHALIVPRVTSRREQLIRSNKLHDLGLLDVLHPNKLTSAALTEWLARDLGPPPPSRRRIDLKGKIRLRALLTELLATSPYAARNNLGQKSLARAVG